MIKAVNLLISKKCLLKILTANIYWLESAAFKTDFMCMERIYNQIDRTTIRNAFEPVLPPFIKYLRLTLVFMWNCELQKKFNFSCSSVFC